MIRKLMLFVQVVIVCASVLPTGHSVRGQEQEPEPATTQPKWHVVKNVMDIDKLPKGATHVDAGGISCAYLEFLAEVSSLTHVSLGGAKDMTPDRISGFSKLPKLQHLHLTWANWSGRADYSAFLKLGSLRMLSIDPFPRSESASDTHANLNALAQLMERGVDVSLSSFEAGNDRLKNVAAALPNLTGLKVEDLTDEDLRLVSNLQHLRSLSISSSFQYRESYSDIGLAHLARSSKITSLSCSLPAKPEFWFQVGRIASLNSLLLSGLWEAPTDARFKELAKLRNIKELDLAGVNFYEMVQDKDRPNTWTSSHGRADTSELDNLPPLDRLVLDASAFANVWNTLSALPAKHIELRVSLARTTEQFLWGEVAAAPDSIVESVVLHGWFNKRADALAERAAVVFGACPKLTRIELRFGGYTDEGMKQILEMLRKAAPKATVLHNP